MGIAGADWVGLSLEAQDALLRVASEFPDLWTGRAVGVFVREIPDDRACLAAAQRVLRSPAQKDNLRAWHDVFQLCPTGWAQLLELAEDLRGLDRAYDLVHACVRSRLGSSPDWGHPALSPVRQWLVTRFTRAAGEAALSAFGVAMTLNLPESDDLGMVALDVVASTADRRKPASDEFGQIIRAAVERHALSRSLREGLLARARALDAGHLPAPDGTQGWSGWLQSLLVPRSRPTRSGVGFW